MSAVGWRGNENRTKINLYCPESSDVPQKLFHGCQVLHTLFFLIPPSFLGTAFCYQTQSFKKGRCLNVWWLEGQSRVPSAIKSYRIFICTGRRAVLVVGEQAEGINSFADVYKSVANVCRCVLVGVACVCRCTVYFDIFIPVVFNFSSLTLSLCPTPDIYIIFAHVDKCMHSMMEDKLRRIKRNESKTLSGRGIFMIAFTNDKDYCHYHCIYGNSYSSLIFWSRYHCVDCCLQFLSNGVRCKMPTTPRIAKSTFHFNL